MIFYVIKIQIIKLKSRAIKCKCYCDQSIIKMMLQCSKQNDDPNDASML